MIPPDIGAGGILLLDKPVGLSSNAALQRVRRAYGHVKAGHTGSLDPLASGMLPICLGQATKLAGELLAGRKCYTFALQLGEARSTGDAEGEVVERTVVPALTAATVEAALAPLRGPQLQVPPMYSALKHQGQPLYKLARQGIEIERAARPVTIHTLELLELGLGVLQLRTLCSSGTYVRTLGEQVARALGSCGFLAALRRDYVEPFEREPMWTLELLDAGQYPARLLAADRAVPLFPAVRLDAAAAHAIQQGRVVVTAPTTTEAAVAPASGTVRLYDERDRFFGLGERSASGAIKARRLYASS
jgi:tRNA pseudouridine55 synthase